MRIWKDENGGTVTESQLWHEWHELRNAGNIPDELNFPAYIAECEGKNGTLTLIGEV